MNEHTYDEIKLGHTESFTVEITDKMMRVFSEITGDTNPLHMDKEFAISQGNTDRVVYGMLTSAFLSTLAGMYLPGKFSVIQKVEVDFRLPVYIGDTLIITGEVISKTDSYKLIEVKVTGLRSGEKVLRGKMRIGVQK